MHVKICGLRRLPDVECAVEAGADAIGFVLSESPRRVGPDDADRLAAAVPSDVLTVAVFRGVPVPEIRQAMTGSRVRAIQLHGDYRPADFASLRDLPFQLIRATSVRSGETLRTGDSGEDILILDSQRAGSGETWDWSSVADPGGQWMLAGGLHPGNVAEAVAAVRPWGVDVSSGVESSRGVKDPGRIREFIAAARATAPA
ncbi:phosphoribosylanthranilate isomerase [Streptomyces sp. NPDC127108]|uniref:phosphoribosylanthranilate isomerase n=1 Tax=Streptomyces sp. NPDC127108 TaxID=3345361 RepID=UPI00362E9F5A